MRQHFPLLSIFIFSLFSLNATAAPKYPVICIEMTTLAREIAMMNDAMVEQMRNLEYLEQKQRKEWATASNLEREQMEKFCLDSKNKLLSLKKTINVIFQQSKK